MKMHAGRLAPWFTLSRLFILACFLSGCNFAGQGDDGADALKPAKDQTVIKKGEPCLDTDGKIYPTIIIGKQTWMAKNLEKIEFECDSNIVVQFTNGLERGPGVTFYDGKPRYAYYNNRQDNGFGVIYNFAVLQHCNICPPGYRIPTKLDWESLIETLGSTPDAGKSLFKNGKSGFNAEKGGRIDSYGSVLAGNLGFWWSSDPKQSSPKSYEAYVFEVNSLGIIKIKAQDIRSGNYIRCIKE